MCSVSTAAPPPAAGLEICIGALECAHPGMMGALSLRCEAIALLTLKWSAATKKIRTIWLSGKPRRIARQYL
jgi:hypothetical protein